MPAGLVLVVGAMRAGTTTVHRYLGGHPLVAASPHKEVHYFDDHQSDQDRAWYRLQFPDADAAAWLVDATPNYMYDPAVCDRIAAHDADARIVAILRDPVTRAYSHYLQKRSFGSETLGFADALDAEPQRLAASPRDRRLFSYVDRGRYLRQLLPYERAFGAEQMHIMIAEELRDEPDRWRSLWSFLELDPRPAPTGRPANRYVEFRSPRLRRASKDLPRPLAGAIGRLNTRRAAPPALGRADRTRLRETFADEVAALSAWLGRDLTSVWR